MPWTSDDAKVVREMIKQEGDVTNHRITWMVTLQGLLFAALGFSWKEGGYLIYVLSGIGITSSFSSLFALHIAHVATIWLQDQWGKNRPAGYEGPPVIGHLARGMKRLALPWVTLPTLFILAWGAVVWINHLRPLPGECMIDPIVKTTNSPK